MALIVQKYGGTSFGTLYHIKYFSRRVVAARSVGVEFVIVVSAFSGYPSRLFTFLLPFSDSSYSLLPCLLFSFSSPLPPRPLFPLSSSSAASDVSTRQVLRNCFRVFFLSISRCRSGAGTGAKHLHIWISGDCRGSERKFQSC